MYLVVPFKVDALNTTKGTQLKRYMLSKILLILIMAAILNSYVNPLFFTESERGDGYSKCSYMQKNIDIWCTLIT